MVNKVNSLIVLLVILSCNKNTDNNPNPTPMQRDGVYNNGPLSTGPISNNGITAPAGYQWSESQNNTGNNTVSNCVTGFACNYSPSFNYKAADDFTIPVGQKWNISKISVYVNGLLGVSGLFDALYIQIWNGNPSLTGSSVVFGNLSTNVLSASLDSLLFPILNSAIPAPGFNPTTTETIWKLSANVNTTLQAGTYWLVYQAHKTNNTPCYSPPVKIKGIRSLPEWNSIVFNSLYVWQPCKDLGNPYTLPWLSQDLPFEILYNY